MADIESDITLLDKTIKGDFGYNRWGQIYPVTTEDVKRVLDIITVEDKDVFAVLSSSDIYFSLLMQKPRSIKTFDINPLTYRYYYLRKWMLEAGIIDGKNLEYEEIRTIIEKRRRYVNEDEFTSVELWLKYLSQLERELFVFYDARLFNHVNSRRECIYDDRLDELVGILKEKPLEFECLNIGEEGLDVNDTYDVVYLSNIMDLEATDPKQVRDNLYRMLRDKGYVIVTNLVNHPYFDFYKFQRKIFDEKFIYEELFTENFDNGDKARYYRYIKR